MVYNGKTLLKWMIWAYHYFIGNIQVDDWTLHIHQTDVTPFDTDIQATSSRSLTSSVPWRFGEIWWWEFSPKKIEVSFSHGDSVVLIVKRFRSSSWVNWNQHGSDVYKTFYKVGPPTCHKWGEVTPIVKQPQWNPWVLWVNFLLTDGDPQFFPQWWIR